MVTCVLGRNGVGKTSLLDALAGQHPVSRGTITLEGIDITALRPPGAGAGLPRRRLRAARPRNLSAADGREESPDRFRTTQARRLQHSGGCLQTVSGLPEHATPARWRPVRRPAAAACHRPSASDAAALLLLLDEPTEGIQPSIIKDIGRAISYLRSLVKDRDRCWLSNISTLLANSATISR